MMRTRSIRTLLTAAAGLAVFAMAQSADAAAIANFNQNPQTPPAPGFSVAGTNFVGANIPVDWTFLVPPGATGTYASAAPFNTIGANMSITGGGLVAGTGVAGIGGSLQQLVDFTFSVVVRGAPNNNNVGTAPAGTNLLSGRLTGVLNVVAGGGSATMALNGASWTSGVQYDAGSGAQFAQQLLNYTAGWTLTGITPGATLSGGNIVGIASVSQITGGFNATPEPASMVMLGLGLAAIPAVGLIRRRFATA